MPNAERAGVTERLSPAEILKQMEAAQKQLEAEEQKRISGLLKRREECLKEIAASSKKLEGVKQTLGEAEKSIAGKKRISEEYLKGLEELKTLSDEAREGVKNLTIEIQKIEEDPTVIEALRDEAKKEDVAIGTEREKKAAEQKRKEEISRAEKEVDSTALELINFWNEDRGWALTFTNEKSGYSQETANLKTEEQQLQNELRHAKDDLAKRWLLKSDIKDRIKKLETLLKNNKDKTDELTKRCTESYDKFNKLQEELGKKIGLYEQVIKGYNHIADMQETLKRYPFCSKTTSGFYIKDFEKFFEAYGFDAHKHSKIKN